MNSNTPQSKASKANFAHKRVLSSSTNGSGTTGELFDKVDSIIGLKKGKQKMEILSEISTPNPQELNIEEEKAGPAVEKEALVPFNSPLVLR
jgi:hypothetical protein